MSISSSLYEHENQMEVLKMKFNVKKLETVATTAMTTDSGSIPWKEAKKQCL